MHVAVRYKDGSKNLLVDYLGDMTLEQYLKDAPGILSNDLGKEVTSMLVGVPNGVEEIPETSFPETFEPELA